MKPNKEGVEIASTIPQMELLNSFNVGDTLISNIRPYFKKIWFSNKIGAASNDVLIFRPKENIDPKFLFYSLSQNDFFDYTMRSSKGTKMPRGDKTAIMNFEIYLPPLNIQKAISRILSNSDDKIELNRKMNETLEQMARAIFKSWFIDFDPVHAKRNGKKPFGMDEATAALFPDSFEESELGKIPKGWKLGKVSDLFNVNTCTLSMKDKLSYVDYIEISGVGSGYVNNVTSYEWGQEPSRAKRRLQHFDTVISTVRPDRGAYFLSVSPKENLIVSTGFAVLSSKNQKDALFGHISICRKEFFDGLGRLADGGAYPAIRPEVILAQPAIIPTIQIREAFHNLTEPFITLSNKNQIESKTLEKTRNLLLPWLLSGEILGEIHG